MEFQVFHRYNRLVRRGLAKPLTHACGQVYVTGFGVDDEPVLKCLYCDSVTVPGQRLYDDIRAVVKEHFG